MTTPEVHAKRISTPIIEKSNLTEKYFRLSIRVPEIAACALPGQFLMIKPDQRYHPLLLRPFSIHRILPDGVLQLFIRRVGLGTSILSHMQPGERLEVLGPLGNGFSIPSNLEMFLIVAGGMGIAPFPALVETIRTLKPQSRIHLFFGIRDAHELNCLDLFEELDCQIHVTTEDGSFGVKGIISQEVEKFLKEMAPQSINPSPLPSPRRGEGQLGDSLIIPSPPSSGERVRVRGSKRKFPGNQNIAALACGPVPMLQKMSELAKEYKISLQVSLESHMACGIGSCLGCPVKVITGDQGSASSWIYQRVCHDGPVFEAHRIIWEG